jgi:hypothetical protein
MEETASVRSLLAYDSSTPAVCPCTFLLRDCDFLLCSRPHMTRIGPTYCQPDIWASIQRLLLRTPLVGLPECGLGERRSTQNDIRSALRRLESSERREGWGASDWSRYPTVVGLAGGKTG